MGNYSSDTGLSLYRKWRPQSLNELVGQEHVAKTLSNAIKSGLLTHAYLFCGPRGTGKTSTARILAKSLNCAEGPTTEPCGKCPSCLDIASASAMDVIEMDAASNRRIEDIRELRERIYHGASSNKKIYIIDEVHMLTTEASNALLKILEEPPEHVIFVLATTEHHKVLPTIVSRCQRFDFRRVDFSATRGRLREIADAEKIGIDDAALSLIAKHAGGSMRDAIGILEQLAVYGKNKVGAAEVADMLGLGTFEELSDLLAAVAANDAPALLTGIASMASRGLDMSQLVRSLLSYCRDLYVVTQAGTGQSLRALVEATDEERETMRQLGERLGAARLRLLVDTLVDAHRHLRSSADPKIGLELALLAVAESAPAKVEEDVREESLSSTVVGNGETPSAPAVGLLELRRAWDEVASRVKEASLGAYLVLIESRPDELVGDRLVIGCQTQYHADQLQRQETRDLVSDAVSDFLGKRVAISCRVSGKADEGASFDTVIDTLRKSFGAEVVED